MLILQVARMYVFKVAHRDALKDSVVRTFSCCRSLGVLQESHYLLLLPINATLGSDLVS